MPQGKNLGPDSGFHIELPPDWLSANPLSAAALEEETVSWKRVGFALRIKPYDLRKAAE